MEIFVKDLNAKTISLDATNGVTFANVKILIQTQIETSPDLQVLQTSNTSLNSSQPISSLNIQQQSTVSLVNSPKSYTTPPSVDLLAISNGNGFNFIVPVTFGALAEFHLTAEVIA